jgi:putative protease
LVGQLERVERARGRTWLCIRAETELSRGDGLLIEGGFASEGELGGRVWDLESLGSATHDNGGGRAARGVRRTGHGGGAIVGGAESVGGGEAQVRVWLGPDVHVPHDLSGGRVFRTSAPGVEKRIRAHEAASKRTPLAMKISGAIGEPFVLEGVVGERRARVVGDGSVEAARSAPVDEATLREKLGRLGDTPFELGALEVALPPNVIVPLSSVNRARRALVAALTERAPVVLTNVHADELIGSAVPPDRAPPGAGLFVLCRTLEQASSALDAGAAGVYLDFLELTGTGDALRALRARAGAFVGVAPPRIRKPGEEKIDRYLASLAPDAVLVRGLGALRELDPARSNIGDFSLNVTNRITAAEVLARGLDAFTPSFDLDAAQLVALARTGFGPWMETVLHHPMALFHMEHCVIAALMSEGRDYKTCGRPCEKHRISLRDRAGMDHPVEADVGCRNTVFHARPQSAVQLLPELVRAGVRRFRIELVRETAEDVRRLVTSYREAIADPSSSARIWKTLRTDGGYGVVKGSLRVLG